MINILLPDQKCNSITTQYGSQFASDSVINNKIEAFAKQNSQAVE